MIWKSFVLNIMWVIICVIFITLLSTQDKEWFIDGHEIKNICDVMSSVENDDVRLEGMFYTLTLFTPFLYAIVLKKQRSFWQYTVVVTVAIFWLWRFVFRYQMCF